MRTRKKQSTKRKKEISFANININLSHPRQQQKLLLYKQYARAG